MITNKRIIAVILLLLGLGYLVSGILFKSDYTKYSRAFSFLVLCTYYLFRGKKTNPLFLLFLLGYMLAETTVFYYIEFREFANIFSLVCYIISYSSLLAFMFLKINMKELFKRFTPHLIILLLFGSYTFYILNNIINENFGELPLLDFFLENLYNILIIKVLIVSFLNYLYHDITKALLLFIACLFIVFFEFTQLAYYFLKQHDIVNVICSLFLFSGFLFVFLYVNHDKNTKSISSSEGMKTELEIKSL